MTKEQIILRLIAHNIHEGDKIGILLDEAIEGGHESELRRYGERELYAMLAELRKTS